MKTVEELAEFKEFLEGFLSKDLPKSACMLGLILKETGSWIETLSLYRKSLGKKFFPYLVELLRRKSFAQEQLNLADFPDIYNDFTREGQAEAFLKKVYLPLGVEEQKFREILKRTVLSFWFVLSGILDQVEKIIFAHSGGMGVKLTPGDIGNWILFFSETLSLEEEGEVRRIILHEFCHILLPRSRLGESSEADVEFLTAFLLEG